MLVAAYAGPLRGGERPGYEANLQAGESFEEERLCADWQLSVLSDKGGYALCP